MRHFRAQEEKDINQMNQKLSFDEKLRMSLKTITKLLLFVEFTVNYGYAIENVWVTMLMIVHGLQDMVDSFVWIVPIIIAILIRPYIVRYVHQINYKVYRQISMVSLFLGLGGISCFIVGWSCGMTSKKEIFKRILVSSIGWTLMDLSFQFCQFFAEKIQESYKSLDEELSKDKEESGQSNGHWTNKQNFQFYGLVLGYLVSLLICWIIQGRTVKQFYRCCKYAYWSVGGLAMITALRLYVQSFVNMPKRDDHEDKEQSLSALPLSTNASFYLPGLMQLLRSDRRTMMLVFLHGTVVFMNDIVMIYATMWFSQPSNYKFSRYAQSLIAGLEYGSVALLCYTIVDTLKINNKYLHFVRYFEGVLALMIILSCYTWYSYSYIGFALISIWVGILNKFYRHMVYNQQSQQNIVFERCIEMMERGQKIAVLCFMPAIILLGLRRDDIRDCLVWAAGMALIGLTLYILSRKSEEKQEFNLRSSSGTRKVNKIE